VGYESERFIPTPSAAKAGVRGHHHSRNQELGRGAVVSPAIAHDLSPDPRPPFKEHPMTQQEPFADAKFFIKLLDFHTRNQIRHLFANSPASLKDGEKRVDTNGNAGR